MGEVGAATAFEFGRSTRRSVQIYSDRLGELFGSFRGLPIDVSFRELVGVLPADDQTHAIFPYPARLIRHIPRMLLASEQIVDGIDLLVDPFCGSGTVLLEARNRGIDAYGIDQNPIAVLVSSVKTTPLMQGELLRRSEEIAIDANRTRKRVRRPEFLKRWYGPDAFSALSRLMMVVSDGPADPVGQALRLAFILTARRVSRTDRRIPVPVRDRDRPDARASDVWAWWKKECATLDSRLTRLPSSNSVVDVRVGDSRNQESWPRPGNDGASTLLFTSPPYGAAQKYIRSTSLDAGWLGHTTERGTINLERASIGREHLTATERGISLDQIEDASLVRILKQVNQVSPTRAAIYAQYFGDMDLVARNAASAGIRRIVMISGPNTVSGIEVPTNEILNGIFARRGMRQVLSLRDPIRGRSLLTTRKSGSTPAPAEFIDVMEPIV